MHTDLDTLVIALYVKIDQTLQDNPSLTGAPWWRHLSRVPANPGAVGSSPPSLAGMKAERSSRGPTVRDASSGNRATR